MRYPRVPGHVSFLLAFLALWPVEASAAVKHPELDRVRPGVDRNGVFTVRLGSFAATPLAGDHSASFDESSPFVLQFKKLPSAAERRDWSRAGLELSRYVGGYAYLARCRKAGCALVQSLPGVRASLELSPEMKRSDAFRSDPGIRRRLERGEHQGIVVVFGSAVTFEQARQLLEGNGVEVAQTEFGSGRIVRTSVDSGQLEWLLGLPEVEWIDPALPPPAPTADDAATRLNVHKVCGNKAFKGANGRGVGVALVDNYPVDTHTDLEDRVIRVRVRPSIDHGTAMSGIIAGAGILDSRARGMAPRAKLYWYTMAWDPWLELSRGRERYGFSIVNNSWTVTIGWWSQIEDVDYNRHWSWREGSWAWGYYHVLAAAGDAAIRDNDLLWVFAAANQREQSFLGPHTHGDQYEVEDGLIYQDLHDPNPDYGSIAGHAIAKNVLTVGGTTKEDAMVNFSSWGPTDDGRVKPEVVATALEILSLKHSDGYGRGSGTSNSTAAASGTAALLTDYYKRKHKEPIRSVALKNLLIHSARDLGEPGPDYIYGFGLIDAELAARVLRDAAKNLMLVKSLGHKKKRTYSLPVASAPEELRASLVWHDAPGRKLVNDLDLWLISPSGKRFRPFKLRQSQPSQPARRGRNSVDNVELVRIEDPEPGKWRIKVRGTRVPMGPQEFSLIVSTGDGNRAAEIIDRGSCSVGDFYTTSTWYNADSVRRKDRFRYGERINLHLRPSITDNGDYGSYYGSIRATFEIRNATGNKLLRSSYETHGNYLMEPRLNGIYQWQELVIPNQMPAGRYTARVILTMPSGCRDTANHRFWVE